jgi:DNA-binding MarR family transcriptional regulator
MEKAGLVERKHDAEDQRVSRVYLTEAGRALQGDVERVWRRLEDEIFDGFTLEERVLLRRFFSQMRENLMRVTRRERSHRGRKR